MHSPYNREGCEEDDPGSSPHALALVVPAVAEVHRRVRDSGQAAEPVRHPDGENVVDQPSEDDPAHELLHTTWLFVMCLLLCRKTGQARKVVVAIIIDRAWGGRGV